MNMHGRHSAKFCASGGPHPEVAGLGERQPPELAAWAPARGPRFGFTDSESPFLFSPVVFFHFGRRNGPMAGFVLSLGWEGGGGGGSLCWAD